MTVEEFSQLEPGQCFERQAKPGGLKKRYRILRKEDGKLIACPTHDVSFRVHFHEQQAAQLEKRDDMPADPESIAESQGIPILPAAELALSHVAGAPKRVTVDFEGVVAEARPATAELGPPIEGGINFLHETLKAGHYVKLCTTRDVRLVRRWLQVHSGPVDIEIVHTDDVDVYLSARGLRFTGLFPSLEDL